MRIAIMNIFANFNRNIKMKIKQSIKTTEKAREGFSVCLGWDRVSLVQSLSRVWLFATPWTATCQASLSTNSQSLLKLMSIVSVMPSNHLILCYPLLLLPSIFPSIRVFSNVLAGSSHQVDKVLELQLQHQSFQWIFRTDLL